MGSIGEELYSGMMLSSVESDTRGSTATPVLPDDGNLDENDPGDLWYDDDGEDSVNKSSTTTSDMDREWHKRRNQFHTVSSKIQELDSTYVNELTSQIAELTKQVRILSMNRPDISQTTPVHQNELCGICGEYGHGANVCMNARVNMVMPEEEVNALQDYQLNPRNDPYSNTYNPSWRNHPNFKWGGNKNNNQVHQQKYQPPPFNQPPQYQQPPQVLQRGQPFQGQPSNAPRKPSLEDSLQSFIQASEKVNMANAQRFENIEASIRRVETQVGQLAGQVQSKQAGKLPSQPEQAQAITVLRSGREVDNKVEHKGDETELDDEDDKVNEEVEVQTEKRNADSQKEDPTSVTLHKASQPYKPPIPFPSRLKNEKEDKNFSDFYHMLSKVNVNLPLLDVIRNIPAYAKFLKELVSKKRRLDVDEKILVSEVSSAVLQHKLPPKQRDPGSFVINIALGNGKETAGMLDLGAGINLMSYSIFQHLELGELKPTRMCLQLADRSIRYPKGIIEDILVQVGGLIVPVDFIVLDVGDVPTDGKGHTILLGRPFMATTNTLIDVKNGKLTMTVLGETITFSLFNTSPIPTMTLYENCAFIDFIDAAVEGTFLQDPYLKEFEELEVLLVDEALEGLSNDEVLESLEVELYGEKVSEPEPVVELKELPKNLKYVFLDDDKKKPVIINAELSESEEFLLVEVLRENQRAIGWGLSDIKGISPTMCMHKIILEDGAKPVRDAQRRLNPNMLEVIKKEVLKLLAEGVIYAVADSEWVSPVHVVPKKSGITVVENDKGELVPTRMTTGWRMCIDYRKLNAATKKDHFPLPFIDQMLDKLAGHLFYCFLDGLSGYYQVAIAPEDQAKTTFTCPFGTFAFRRMPFGLCNAPATFQRCMLSIFSDMVEDYIEIGYRDGLIAGKEAAAQEGFNIGFKDSVFIGYNWGHVRGITSALACLPGGLREKMVETEEARNKFRGLHESVQSLSTTDALKLFYVDQIGKPLKENESGKPSLSTTDLHHPSRDVGVLENYHRQLQSLVSNSPLLKCKEMNP